MRVALVVLAAVCAAGAHFSHARTLNFASSFAEGVGAGPTSATAAALTSATPAGISERAASEAKASGGGTSITRNAVAGGDAVGNFQAIAKWSRVKGNNSFSTSQAEGGTVVGALTAFAAANANGTADLDRKSHSAESRSATTATAIAPGSIATSDADAHAETLIRGNATTAANSVAEAAPNAAQAFGFATSTVPGPNGTALAQFNGIATGPHAVVAGSGSSSARANKLGTSTAASSTVTPGTSVIG